MIKKFLATSVATASMLGAAYLFPSFAATDVVVSGNGFASDNNVQANMNQNTSLSQVNDTNIRNDVNTNNNTGYNSTSGNTGGNVEITTGDANADVSIHNMAGLNNASISGGNNRGDTQIGVFGNGAFSDNNVRVFNNNTTRLNQRNNTDITNNVNVRNNTGFNSASGNTGSSFWNPWGGRNNGGDVSIDTGNAESNVSIHNMAGLNEARISGGNNSGDTHVTVAGNGAYSDNNVRLNDNNTTRLNQSNYSDFSNDVNVNNNTGYNRAGGGSSGFFMSPRSFYPSDYNNNNRGFYTDGNYGKYMKHDGMYAKHDYYPQPSYNQARYDDGYMRNYNKNQYFPLMKFQPAKVSYYPKMFETYKPVYVPVSYKANNNYDCGYANVDHNTTMYRPSKLFSFNPYSNNQFLGNYMRHYTPYAYNDYGKNYGKNKYYQLSSFYPMKGYLNRFPFSGGNTFGDVSIHTGDANSQVMLDNAASANFASL